MSDTQIVGQTRDTGFQIGVRRTLPISLAEAWRLLTSLEGVRAWLGEADGLGFAKGETYRLADGARGEVRVFEPDHHLRITWHPAGWERASTIQIRVIPAGERTTISFHQEHLPGAAEREERREHFAAALDTLTRLAGAA